MTPNDIKPITPEERRLVVDFLVAQSLERIAWKWALTPDEASSFGIADVDNEGMSPAEIDEHEKAFAADPLGIKENAAIKEGK